jgi:hypothetical protein
MFRVNFEQLFDATLPASVHLTLVADLHVDWDACVRLVHVLERSPSRCVVKEFVALRPRDADALLQLYARLPVCDVIERPLAAFRSTTETLCLLFPEYGNCRRRLLPGEMWCVATQLVDALVHLKGAGVFHRNITLGNVLISEALQVRLIDFGDAALVAADLDVPTNGHFRPPENEFTFASDTFAAGIVLAALYLNSGDCLFPFDRRDDVLAALDALPDARPSMDAFWRRFNDIATLDRPDTELENLLWRMIELDHCRRIDIADAQLTCRQRTL